MSFIFSYFSLTSILIYLYFNIKSEGGESVSIVFLVSFFAFSSIVFFRNSCKFGVYCRVSFFFFLLFLFWLILRWAFDLNDVYRLVQMTVATTGGILTFYLVGVFFRQNLDELLKKPDSLLKIKYLFFFSGLIVPLLFFVFSDRIRTDIFYLEGIDGAYQRSGNFLSILFLIFSIFYLFSRFECRDSKNRSFKEFGQLFYYLIGSLLYLACSQLIGSNSATGVILGSFFLMLILSSSGTSRGEILCNKFGVSNSSVIAFLGVHAFSSLIFLTFFLCFFILVALTIFDFELGSLNIFGFGDSEFSSLTSRMILFLENGVSQLSHSPVLGNMNVSYIVTGEEGKYIHSLFPYVLANLGLVGLVILLALIALVCVELFQELGKASFGNGHVKFFLIRRNTYFLSLLFYLVFFANLSVEISWPVIWFSLGFMSKPFGHIKRSSNI